VYSEINAGLNDVQNVESRHSDILTNVAEAGDLFVSNPPYLQDSAGRTYRHGGDHLGTDLSLRILEQALFKLPVGGKLLLYTGVPVMGGIDLFWRAAGPLLAHDRFRAEYDEIDPDVFGEELESQTYAECDRLAVVQLLVSRVGM